jgi:hypothetical protein
MGPNPTANLVGVHRSPRRAVVRQTPRDRRMLTRHWAEEADFSSSDGTSTAVPSLLRFGASTPARAIRPKRHTAPEQVSARPSAVGVTDVALGIGPCANEYGIARVLGS